MAPQTCTWPGFVARVATPATPVQIVATLADAWPAVIGTEPTRGELSACAAQVMLETGARMGRPPTGYWNGNAGNVRGEYGEGRWWTSFAAGEGYGAHAVTLAVGPANRFRSYVGPFEDPADPEVQAVARARGVRDYLSLLVRRYPAALACAALDDMRGYVAALHAGGYFTAHPGTYARTEEALRATILELPQVRAFA